MTQTVKVLFIGSIALNVILVIGSLSLFIHYDGPKKLMDKISHNRAAVLQDMDFYYKECSIFDILPKQKQPVVFIGNSVLAGCPWNELWGNLRLQNRSIGGDGTVGVINRLQSILGEQPAAIIMGIGRSDIVFGLSYDSIMHNIDVIVTTAQKQCKNVQFVILSEIPWRPDILVSRPFNNNNIHELNGRIKKYAEARALPFVDFAAFVSDKEGALDPAYTFDGVHPNGKAYIKLKAALDSIITKVLMTTPRQEG